MNKEPRILSPSIFTVSFDDMIDIWVETMHPDDNVVVVWDANKHIDVIKASGFILNDVTLFNNKVLTILLDDVRDCFYVMDVLGTYEQHPYMQIYSGGKLLTDNLENLRADLEDLPN
tara:strand:- start:1546 stop:1896 length:351 start_codon:yes stop_codon:yes gene_type:complete